MFVALVTARRAGQESPSQYRAKYRADTNHRKARDNIVTPILENVPER